MTTDLSELRSLLIEGQQLSRQGSYERRAPNKSAMPKLLLARNGLAEFVKANPGDAAAWRLLSLAEECLLNYPAAEGCLHRSMSLSPGSPDKRDLKKLALLREYKAKWRTLALTPDQLPSLAAYLDSELRVTACDHSLRLTAAWLKRTGLTDIPAIVSGLRAEGGYCDCEVLANVAQ